MKIETSERFAKLTRAQTIVLAHEGVHVIQQSECCKKGHQEYLRRIPGLTEGEQDDVWYDLIVRWRKWVKVDNEHLFECQAHSLAYLLAEALRRVPGTDEACCAALADRGRKERQLADYHCTFGEGDVLVPCPY